MAASAASAGSTPGFCPSYAVICSFLERYGALLDLPELTFPQLERYLQDTTSVPKLLVDLHVKLLRKIGKSVSADRWEKYLVKVCHEFNSTWAWELENKGYKDMSVECKTGILKHLCECQFDDNVKFKTAINEEDPDKMRLLPIGKDKDGLMYWFQLDQDNNVRVYVEEQDDLDGSSWKCIVRDRNSLAEILALLKTQIDPALLTKKEGEEEDEEKNNTRGEGEVKKTDDTSEDEEDKPSKGTASLVSPKTESTEKEESKLDVSDAKSPLNGLKDEFESKSQSEKPMVDDKVTINTQAIKEEPMEVSESKESTATSATEPLAEKPCLTPQTEQTEEAKRKTAKELQRAMKNDQQAKIPLKKREMKLSEDFDNNSGSGSSIIVRNPSVAPEVEETSKEVSDAQVGTMECKSDQVNGDARPATEKSVNNGLRDSADGKKQQTKAVAGEDRKGSEINLPLDKDKEKGEMASNTEEPMEVAMADETSLQKIVPVEKESTEDSEEVKKSALKEAKSPSPLMTKPLTSSKNATSPPEKSSDCKEEQKVKVSKWDVKVRHTEHTTSTSIETDKNPSSSKSQKPDETQGTDSSIASQEVKSAASKGTDKTVVNKDGYSLSVVKEMEKPTVTEKRSNPKNPETSVIAKQTGRPDPITEKPDRSKRTEMPAVIKNTEKPPSNKEGVEKCDVSKDIKTSSVMKKTEISEKSKDAENLASSKETNTSSVIKKADKPVPNKEAEKLESTKETDKSSVIKMTVKAEASKHTEKCDNPKDIEMSAATKEKTAVSAEMKKKAVLEKDAEKTAICKDEMRTVAKATKTQSGPKDVEMADFSEKTTQSQLDEPKKVEKLATPKDAGKSATPKDTEKCAESATPEDAEKLATLKDAVKSATPKVAEKSAKNTETIFKKIEKSSRGQKPDTSKETEKLADTKPGAEKGEKLVTFEDAKQLPSLKESVPVEGKQEEPMEISSEKSTDDNVKIKGHAEKGWPKKAVKSGEKCELKDTKLMDCDAPSEKQAASKKASSLTETEGETDESQDKVIKEDATTQGCPQKEDGRKDDQAKKDDKKEDDQAKKDDKKEDDGAEKDDKNSTVAEKSGQAKASEGSEEDENKNKEDEDKSEKKDAGTTSEIQEEGIRLKIRGITHRRRAELQREERDSGSDTGETGRSLRRSPRICRPTAKGVEFQDRRLEKKEASPPLEKGDDEEEKTVQRKPREKVDQDGLYKSKGRRRRKTRWSNTRTQRRKKNGSGEDDESEWSEEESEEDNSDESFKVERGKRRRRNRNRERHNDDSDTSSDDDLPPNDDPCKHCGLPNHPELILLCDSCDSGYHTACLRPPVMIIPDGEWFCPPCQHKLLCDKLEEQLTNLDASLKKRERAERRKERLVYVGISVENIITPSLEVEEEKEEEVVKKEKKEKKERTKSWGRRSTRAKKSISYRFDEFDEAIEEAIEEDIREADGGGAGRGKDMANITCHSRGKDMSTILAAGEGGEGKENGRPPRPNAGQRRKKRRRLNDLDSDSTVEEEESEDEFRLSDSTEEEEFVASDKSDAESEAAVVSNDDSDFGSTQRRTARTRRPAKRQRSTQPRRRRRPRGYSDDEEETSEEDEEEMVSEGSSEFSDSDLDCSRRRSRRSQTKKQVNYCESSGDSDGSKANTNRDKVKPRRRLASSDSEASSSRGSDDSERTRLKRRADSSEKESQQHRRRLSLKRRRASEEDDDDHDSDESSEGERPVRKRVNRIDSDDSDKEEEKEKKETKEEEEGGVLGKGASPLDYSLVELHPPTNGQSPIKALEGLAHIGPQKPGATAVAIAPNGLELAPQDDDEDDLLGVTDLVDFVCNSDML
ncbi:remodeling and spacing factor 1-like [Coregonus clupeaformis]|uniref:remodeling and spacing factor 1-like n=1 Tax=Coregonus clupeaformis TaxID=59861 RepID=UPI001E1C3C5C|nr:remodeling and spacing factor 1-like [Coregonus clupeaformis]